MQAIFLQYKVVSTQRLQKSESTSLIVVEPFHLFTEKIQSKMYLRCSHMRDVFGRTHFQYGPSIQSSFSIRELGVASAIASSMSQLGNIKSSSSSSSGSTSTSTNTELDMRVDSICVILIHEVQTQKLPIATLHFGESVCFVNKEGLPSVEDDGDVEEKKVAEEDEDEDDRYNRTKHLTLRLVASSTKISAQCRVRGVSAKREYQSFHTVMFQLRHKNTMRVAHSYRKKVTENPRSNTNSIKRIFNPRFALEHRY